MCRLDPNWNIPANQPWIMLPLKASQCPSTPGEHLTVTTLDGLTCPASTTDYFASVGLSNLLVTAGRIPATLDKTGAMLGNKPQTITDVTDGTSSTLILTGAPVGRVRVAVETVSAQEGADSPDRGAFVRVPPRYARPDTSPLSVDVPAGGTTGLAVALPPGS